MKTELLNGKMKRAGFLVSLVALFSFRPNRSRPQAVFTIPRFERMDDVPSDLKENGSLVFVGDRIVVSREKDGVPLKFE